MNILKYPVKGMRALKCIVRAGSALSVTIATLIGPAQAQQSSPFVGPASDFCLHFVRTSEIAVAPLQRAGFVTQTKRNGHFFGRAENAASNVRVHTQGRNKRKSCLIEVAPEAFGGSAQSEAMFSLLEWSKKEGHKLSSLKKGQMTLLAGKDVVMVRLEAGQFKGRATAYFTFQKKR